MRGGSEGRLLELWNCGKEIASSSSSMAEDIVAEAGSVWGSGVPLAELARGSTDAVRE